MFANFLKVTIRNLYREKMYALINIAGLSIAIACCLVLGLYLKSELTYDRHNTKYKQIFRIIETNIIGNYPNVPTALAPLLSKDYPEIKAFVRFTFVNTEGEPLFRHEDKSFKGGSICYADENIFDVFTHEIIYGDPKTALVDPTSIAINESFSRKHFNDENPIGENIDFDEKTYKITLVFADLPDNTSLKYDILLSYHEKELADAKTNFKPFQMSDCATYLLMPQGYKAQDFKPISDVIHSRYIVKEGIPDFRKYWLQPLSDIHFNSDINNMDFANQSVANKFVIYGFAGVAIFILLVACINYMNLATARSAKRSKEVGVRKILGSGRASLILQFLGEAVIFSLIALFGGLALLELALKLTPINDLLDKHLTLNLLREPGLILWMLAFSMVIGLMAGAYPAIYLSSMPVLYPLKSGHRVGKKSIRFRQALVLIQFTITVSVIACTLLMALQMRYVSRKPLGFEKENRIIITLYGSDLINKVEVIKTELLKNSHILGITQSDRKIGQGVGKMASLGMNNETEQMSFLKIDDNYLKEMGMQLVSGRDFSKRLSTDIGASVIVNEAMVKKKGWEEPLGQSMINFQVIGVVKDFNFASLHSQIEPLGMIRLNDSKSQPINEMRQLILHISDENLPQTLGCVDIQ